MKALFLVFVSLIFLNIQAKELKSHQAPNQQWIDCIIVTTKGDTLKTQIKNKKDYSLEGSLTPNSEIVIRNTGNKEIKMDINSFSELIIPGRPADKKHYLSLNNNPVHPGEFIFYRVVTDGQCKLLFAESTGRAGKTIIDVASGQTLSTSNQQVSDEYYVYYNHSLKLVHVDDDLNLNSISKPDCIEIFKTCPELVKRISERKSKLEKINEMIDIFNSCSEATIK